jgi:hypothetical protein
MTACIYIGIFTGIFTCIFKCSSGSLDQDKGDVTVRYVESGRVFVHSRRSCIGGRRESGSVILILRAAELALEVVSDAEIVFAIPAGLDTNLVGL